MSVLRSKGINSFLKSEKKSLFRFLALYITMIISIIILLSIYYYQTQEKLMLSNKRASLSKYAYIQAKRLKVLHHFFDERVEYPRDPRFKSAIYDVSFKEIFSLLENKNVHFDKEIYRLENHIHFIKSLDDFYLGTKYIVLEIEDDGLWENRIWKNILIFSLAAFLIFLLFGLYLAKLFLKPMRDSIMLLDRFIKDTTHELNTPLSSILANIEMMDTSIMVEKNRKKLKRINIAAKTVSMLYRDLTFLVLEQEKKNHNEQIELIEFLHNRIEYFDILMESKQLTFKLDMQRATIIIDRRKLIRIVDNLLSNAIKYNRPRGTVGIYLRQGTLIIWDSGIGIKENKIPYMFDRYIRFNETEGGFGIGLSIVKKIIDEYHITIEVQSRENKGTKVILKW